MDTRLYAKRILPEGEECYVLPFHVSLEGLESALICRDDEDYDIMTKNIFVSALRANIIVIIYGVVSNHAHVGVLAKCRSDVEKYVNELKRVQSMWISRKYGDRHILEETNNCISEIDTLSYARNALAYIPRNALDNGAINVAEYKWTGFRGMFCQGKPNGRCVPVNSLTYRERERIMHTKMNLKNVRWLLNDEYELEPASTCDFIYLERIFNNDQSFFLSKIGGINASEVGFMLSSASKTKNTDSEFLRLVQECSNAWFKTNVQTLSLQEKIKLIHYLRKKWRMTVPQTARCLGMDRAVVGKLLHN